MNVVKSNELRTCSYIRQKKLLVSEQKQTVNMKTVA